MKSPVPIAVQVGPGLATDRPPPITVVPFISQIAAWPLRICHRMSDVRVVEALGAARLRRGRRKPLSVIFEHRAVAVRPAACGRAEQVAVGVGDQAGHRDRSRWCR